MVLLNQRLPAGLINRGTEFYFNPEIKDIECLHDGRTYSWQEIPGDILDIISEDMAKHPEAIKGMQEWNIFDSEEQLKQYIFCRFGGFDFEPDINEHGEIAYTEYFDCGKRGQCKYEGKICATIKVGVDADGNNITLTKRELEILKLIAQGMLDKEIADLLNINEETVRSHNQNIRQKGGFARKHDMTAFAVSKNLV